MQLGLNEYIYTKTTTMEHYFKIEKVADYLKFRNQKPVHPLIGLVDFYQLRNDVDSINTQWDGLDFDCYAIFLKDNAGCKLKYGGNQYDFDEGTKRVDSIIVRGGGGEYDYYFHVIIFIVERRKRSRYGNDSKRAPICLSRRWVQSVLSRSPGGDDGDSVAKYAPLCRVRRRRAMEQNIDG